MLKTAPACFGTARQIFCRQIPGKSYFNPRKTSHWSGALCRSCRSYRGYSGGGYQYRGGTHGKRSHNRSWLLALSTVAGFSFEKHGVSDERLKQCAHDRHNFDNHNEETRGWEKIYEEKDFRAYRRPVKGPYEMYEYKCVGTYHDISAKEFWDVQNDYDYRKEWDTNIISLESLKEEDDHELVRWVSKYPYPLYPREYLYARRTWVSEDGLYAVADSEVVPEEVISFESNNVRVAMYTSRMSVRAHTAWDKDGCDYILTYADNPEANIPRYVMNWIVNQGGPYFLKQVHAAALKLKKSGRILKSSLDGAIRARDKKSQQDEDRRNLEADAKRSADEAVDPDKANRRTSDEVKEVAKNAQDVADRVLNRLSNFQKDHSSNVTGFKRKSNDDSADEGPAKQQQEDESQGIRIVVKKKVEQVVEKVEKVVDRIAKAAKQG